MRVEMRPALVVSRPLGANNHLFWALMITSAGRSSWPMDVDLRARHLECGLPVPCVIRAEKVAVFRVDAVDRQLGQLPDDLLEAVRSNLREQLALSA
jgi:mRNA-degrading endonuclease toxin of MazEF toxin-antitoxin module